MMKDFLNLQTKPQSLRKKRNIIIFVSGLCITKDIWKELDSQIFLKNKCLFFNSEFLLNKKSIKRLESFLLKNKNRKRILIGWSLGSSALMEYFHNKTKSWDKMILLSLTPRLMECNNYIGYKNSTKQQMMKKCTEDPKSFRKIFLSGFISDRERLKKVISMDNHLSSAEMVFGLQFLFNLDLREVLQNAPKDKELIVINGLTDKIIRSNQSNLIMEYFKDTPNHNVILLNCGHDIIYEERDSINRILLNNNVFINCIN